MRNAPHSAVAAVLAVAGPAVAQLQHNVVQLWQHIAAVPSQLWNAGPGTVHCILAEAAAAACIQAGSVPHMAAVLVQCRVCASEHCMAAATGRHTVTVAEPLGLVTEQHRVWAGH